MTQTQELNLKLNIMKTFEQLQTEWGESTCGRSVERYVFDELNQQNKELLEVLKDIYLHHLPNHTEGNPLIKRLEELLK